MRTLHKVLVLTSILSLAACKSTKSTATVEDLASAKIIATHYETHPQFETLAARLKIKYSDPKTNQSVTVILNY